MQQLQIGNIMEIELQPIGTDFLSTSQYTGGQPNYEAPLPTTTPVGSPSWTIIDMRNTRNTLLARTDWTQASDSPLSDAKKAEYATYRQALRDLTEGDEVVQLIDFPKPPSA